MSHPRSAALAATAVGLICAGCVTSPPGPLPQATPSWSCTPVTGGTPYACYENQYQDAAAQNKLYEEAEAVYRKYNAENERILREGGVAEPTQVLLITTTGEYLDEAMAEYRKLKRLKGALLTGSLDIVWVKRLPDSVRLGTVATMEVCKETSDAVYRGKDGEPYRIGMDTAERLYFAEIGGLLKVASADHQRVESC